MSAAQAQNPFSIFEPSQAGVGRKGVEVTPNNGAELDFVARNIWVGVAGSLHILDEQGNDLTFLNVPVGKFDMVRVRKVFAGGTTAQSLVACE